MPPLPPPPPTRGEPLATIYAALMSQDNDVRVGDIISAWKMNCDITVQSNLHYGRVIFISADEIRTHPSMSDCSIVPTSGMSRLRVCARRVPSGPFVIDPLPLLYPVDVNDGYVDAKLDRRMGAPSTMALVQGHDPRWAKLAEAAAETRATENKSLVDGSALEEADDDGNYPPTLYAKINNSKELAIKSAVEEIGGTYEAALVPLETPNDDVFALVSARRATWRQQLDTLFKPSEKNDSDDDDNGSGAVPHDNDDRPFIDDRDSDGNDDDRPLIDNPDSDGKSTDWSVAALREETLRRHRKENEERQARHAVELAAAIEKKQREKQREATAAKTNEEYAQLPHNCDLVRRANYDVLTVIPFDYDRMLGSAAGEHVVVVGAEKKLFTDVRPTHMSLRAALQADGAEIGTLYRTETGVRVVYGSPPPDGGGVAEETFEIYADGQQEPDDGAWNLVESLYFGVIMVPTLLAPDPVETLSPNSVEPAQATAPAAATALTVTLRATAALAAPAAAAAPAGTPAAQRRTSPPATRRTQPDGAVDAPIHLPAKVGHGATAGYVLGPRALGGVKHGNFWDGDHVRLKREAAPSSQISFADRRYKLVNRGATKVLYIGWEPGVTTANQDSSFLPVSETSLMFDRVVAQQAANLEVALGVVWIRNSRVHRSLAAGDWVKVFDDGANGPRFGKLVAMLRDDRQSGLGSSWRGWVMVPDVETSASKFVFVNNDAIEQVSVVCCRMSMCLTASNLGRLM